MTLLICTECGTILREDSFATSIAYDQEVLILVDKEGDINFSDIPQYFIFVCHKCGFSKHISFTELLRFKQKTAIDVLLRMRVDTGMTSIRGISINEQNGVSYCGVCRGPLDEDGYCYNDIITNCAVRNNFVPIL